MESPRASPVPRDGHLTPRVGLRIGEGPGRAGVGVEGASARPFCLRGGTLTTFRESVEQYGVRPRRPRQRHGLHHPVVRRDGGRNGFETELRRLNIVQKNSRPNHPTTGGKVERLQQTMKKWLRAQPVQPATIAELQALLDTFVECYNHRRPHRSLPQRCTPATAYAARPKATPSTDRTGEVHRRVRTDRVDDTRRRHPPRQRPAPAHRHRPNPRPNPRHPAHPGSRHPRRRRRHRRTSPRTHPRPHQGLPTHRTPTRPHPQTPQMTTAEPTNRRFSCRL
ncbi:integrase core domain-containing protein [Kribbella sp. NPDC002412]